MPRKALKKISTPKKGKKATKTARAGTPPAGGAARRADSPTITGLIGDDDAILEQILDNQGAIGELVKKTSTMEGSLQRILLLLEGKQSEGYDDDDECPRGRGTTTARVKGQRGPSPRRRDSSPRRRDDVTRRDVTTDQQSRTIQLGEQGRQDIVQVVVVVPGRLCRPEIVQVRPKGHPGRRYPAIDDPEWVSLIRLIFLQARKRLTPLRNCCW